MGCVFTELSIKQINMKHYVYCIERIQGWVNTNWAHRNE